MLGLLLTGMIGAGIRAVMAGRDLNWDLLNYHFYNGWAAWTGHVWSNSVPAQLQSFYNPVLDIFQYLAISNLSPRNVAFAIGALQGIGFFLLFLIAWSFGPSRKTGWRFSVAIAAALAGFAGPIALWQIGSTMGDLTLSIPIIAGVFCLLRALNHERPNTSRRFIVLAGLCLGFAAGAKYTMCAYTVAALIALFLCPPAHLERMQATACLAGACAVAFLLVAGPWMLALQKHYASPLFPFYNGIFQSSFATPENFKDARWLPHGFQDWLFLPFTMGVKGQHHMERPFRTLRFALAFTLIAFVLIRAAISIALKRPGRRTQPPAPDQLRARGDIWLMIFFVAGYIIWLKTFGYYRYLCPLEMLAPILILAGTRRLLRGGRTISLVYIALLVLLGASMSYNTRAARSEWTAPDYFNVQLPEMAHRSNTMVLMTSRRPMGFVAPYFPNDARFVRLQSNFDYIRTDRFLHRQLHAIRKHDGPYLLLTATGHVTKSRKLIAFLLGFKVEVNDCSPVRSATREKITLCKVRMVKDTTPEAKGG